MSTSEDTIEYYKEQSKRLDILATVLSSKTARVDRLEEEWRAKIKALDQYIQTIGTRVDLNNLKMGEISQLMGDSEKAILCEKCQTPLCNSLIDKARNIAYIPVPLGQNNSLVDDFQSLDINSKVDPPQPIPLAKSKKSVEKAKRSICSYCSQKGHKRAECPNKGQKRE